MKHVRGEGKRAILTLAKETAANLQIAPDGYDWMSSADEPVREVPVEDLRGGKPAALDTDVARGGAEYRCILVSWATGSQNEAFRTASRVQSGI